MDQGNYLKFKECDICRAKTGSPTLCDGCLHNREAISVLRQYLGNKPEHPIGQNPKLQYNIPIILFGLKTRNELELLIYEAINKK